jgi:FkbM family methyltransferase
MTPNARKKISTYVTKGCYLLSRNLVSVSPLFVSRYLGSRGWTKIIPRSPKLRFQGRLYGSEYKINVQGNYNIERFAAQNKPDPSDPFVGLSKLDLGDKIALDIGANVGTISIGLAALGCKKIYSIEPGPLHARLIDNIELNNLNNIVIPAKIGFGAKQGELFWAEDKNNPGNAHLLKSADGIDLKKLKTEFEVSEFVRVPVITLDEFVSTKVNSNIDIIKIDVEGMEWDVLSGGKDTIESNLPIVVAETHRIASDMMKYDCMTPMFQFFYGLGYRTFSLDEHGDLVEFIYPNFGPDTFFIHQNNL